MRTFLRRSSLALLALVAVAAASLANAIPAQAYPNSSLRWDYGHMYTGTCVATDWSDFNAWTQGNQCRLGNSAFTKDPGGVAFKTEVYYSGSRRANIEFHPYGEILKVCDARNDSDSIHVRLQYQSGGTWHWKPLVSPPGTSTVYECATRNYSFAEGTPIKLWFYDDKSMNDRMKIYTSILA